MATFQRSKSEVADKDGLSTLSKKTYEQQSKHFLNAFWDRAAGGIPEGGFSANQDKAEKIWEYTNEFIKLDKKKKTAGNELDEFEAHQFLEHTVGALTVKDMRTALKEIDIDFNRMMSITEFLIYHYKLTEGQWVYLVNWVPAGSPEQRALLDKVQAQMKTAQAALADSTEAAEASKIKASDSAVAAETAAKSAAASEVAAAEAAEARKALQALQQAKADAIAAQEALSVDESLSTVKRSKAKAQCAILKSEDSQPLRTAEITAGAAERKAKKAAKAAAKTAEDAATAKVAADEAAVAAEKAMSEADEAVHEVTNQLEEAKAACAGSGSEEGTFWWLDREFEEALKYMGPKQKAKAEAARAASRKRSGTTA